MSDSFFGTQAEIDAVRAKRRAEVQEWARKSQAEADAIAQGVKVPVLKAADSPVDEPVVPEETSEPATDNTPEPELVVEEVKEQVKPAAKATKSTSKGSTDAK